MSQVILQKYQTLGNAYLVFDPRRNGRGADIDGAFLKWVSRVCDLHYGIGSNGLLFGPQISDAAFGLQVINSDGSFSEFSGNGSRIFARYLADAGYVAKDVKAFGFVVVSRDGSRITVDVTRDAKDPEALVTDLDIAPAFGPDAVRAVPGSYGGGEVNCRFAAIETVAREFGAGMSWNDSTPVSVGNPHCVTFVSGAQELPSFDALMRHSEAFAVIANAPKPGQSNPVFTDGCNLQWAFVENPHRIQLRIVERGEGPTLASGSSASAAAVAAWRRGLVQNPVEVVMPGGTLDVTLKIDAGRISGISLRARVEPIAEITMPGPD